MKIKLGIGKACFVLLLAGVFVQCQSTPDGGGSGGAAAVSVSLHALSAASVARVRLTVTGPDIAPPIAFDLVASGTTWSGIIGNIPSGVDRTFTAEAFDTADVRSTRARPPA